MSFHAAQLSLFPDPEPTLPFTFAAAVCHGCGTTGCTIWEGGNGHQERLFCDIPCAERFGWPWLVSEQTKQRAVR